MKRVTCLLTTTASIALFSSVLVYAQDAPETGLSLHFETAHILGTGPNIFVHQAPVTNHETGETVYKDIMVEFIVAEDGSILISNIFAEDSLPLPNSANNFIPGTYEDSEGRRYIVSVGGVTADGRTSGSIQADSEGFTFNATWLTGPVEGHPLIGNLPIAPELPEGPSYGLVGANNLGGFYERGVIALAQISTSIVMTAYHSCCPTNTSYGQANITILPIEDNSLPPPPP